MASSVVPGGLNLVLELGGQPAGALRNALPPSYTLTPAAVPGPGAVLQRGSTGVALGALAADADLVENGPLLDWAMSLARGAPASTDGTLLVLDVNFKVQRRIGFVDGLITGLTLPALSASDGKRTFTAGLTWQPTQVSDKPGKDEVVKRQPVRRKALLCNNFQVQGLPFDGRFITDVGLPGWQAHLGSAQQGRLATRHVEGVTVGDLSLVVAGRSVDAALDWVRKVVADGQLDDAEYLDLKVELLDASMKTVLATLMLEGCGLLASEEVRISAAADRGRSLRLRWSVRRLSMVFSGA